MKKNTKIIFFAVVLTVILLAVSSCRPVIKEGKTDDGEAVPFKDVRDYILVRGDLSAEEEKEALVLLHKTLESALSESFTVSTDWLPEGETAPEKEILIGKTKRPESEAAVKGLGHNDYVIKMVGTKLVIAGGSGESTKNAVEYFIANYIDTASGAVSYPAGEGYKHVETFTIDSITIAGTPISEYSLYTSIPDLDLSGVQNALKDEIAGVYLEIDESYNQYKKYIIFDDTELIASKYGTELDASGNLFVYGSYDTFPLAIEYFSGEYFDLLRSEQGSKINIDKAQNKTLYSEKKEIYTKESLLALLRDVYEDENGILIGQNVSATSMPSYALDRFYEGTGKYPAMLGIDLGFGGLHLTEISSSEWSRAICELTDFAAEGGIISARALYENPTGNWTVGDGKYKGELGGEENWEALLTEGSDLNTIFGRELAIYAAFIKALGDNGVPILFAPLSEANASDYWFGASAEKIPAELVKELWIYIRNYYESLGLDNIIWVYDPAMRSADGKTLTATYYYPGDEYVDIVGTSWLYNGKNSLDGGEASQKKLTDSTGKIGAICKFGIDTRSDIFFTVKQEQEAAFSSLDLLEMLYDLRGKGYSFSYMLMSGNGDLYWLGHGAEFATDEMILTLDDVSEKLK